VNAPTLFDEPRSRHTDPDTSRQAALRVASVAKSLEAQILDALAFRNLTDDAICLSLNIDARRWPSAKTARSRLKGRGLVVWSGDRRNGQQVWCLPQNRPAARVELVGDVL